MGGLAPPIGLPNRVDVAVGNGVERLIARHHRRRLRRIGRLDALDAPAGGWAVGGPPPRSGSAVEVLVDGAEALPRIADEIERAGSSVWLAGWFFSPDFRLRAGDGTTLRELLAEAAERVDVRVLAWAGSPLPLFHPDRRELRAMRDEFVRGTRIRCALDARERPLHCHHEKLVLVDDRVAFVGGIDSREEPARPGVLTSYSGDRFDTREHLRRDGGRPLADGRLGEPQRALANAEERVSKHDPLCPAAAEPNL